MFHFLSEDLNTFFMIRKGTSDVLVCKKSNL
jgi:hypothetical protein